MKLPNGYGSVIKMAGKRRKPYAVRTSDIMEYVDLFAPSSPPDMVSRNLKRLKFRWNRKVGGWSSVSTDSSRAYAIELYESAGCQYKIVYRQKWVYHAYFEKKGEAYSFLAELNSGNVVKDHKRFTDSPTFAEMFEKWKVYRSELKRKIAAKTWNNYVLAFNHLAPLHNKKISAINVDDIQPILNSYNQMSYATVAGMRAVLNGVFSYAKMNNYVEAEPTKFLVYEWAEPEESIHAPYTEDEIAALWERVDKIADVDIILIYIYTGLRPSELLDILIENVHIDEQYMIGGSKTDAGKDRIIPIADKILPLVRERYSLGHKYLISSKRGRHYTYDSYVRTNFSVVMDKLGFEHLPHDTRHTFASMMDSANANDTCTKLIIGHSMKGDITKGVYTHKTVRELLDEVNKI